MAVETQVEILSIGVVDPTPLGAIWVALSQAGLVAVEMGVDQETFTALLRKRWPGWRVVFSPEATRQATQQIGEYLQGRRRAFDLPIDWRGMRPFQMDVLRATCAIPYAQVTTYGEIARRLGRPAAARAVGRVEASNPMPLVIPCHRVIGADGSLHGYGAPGGLETKAWLLRLEAQTAQS
jgi:methylated-DNA-[protein]-cysteine S-methyltransferase